MNIKINPIDGSNSTLITPEMAKDWLTGYGHAYRIRKPRLYETMLSDMQHNRWDFNGSAILINEDTKQIIDGVMRLSACIESNVAIRSYIISVNDTSVNIDTGAVRTFTQALKHHGYTNVSGVAGTFTRYYSYVKGDNNINRIIFPVRYSNCEMLDALSEYQDDIKYITNRYYQDLSKVSLTAAPICALAMIFKSIDPKMAIDFMDLLVLPMDKLVTMVNDTDPILLVRKSIDTRQTSGTPYGYQTKSALVVKAWNYWRKGATTRAIYWRMNGKNPEPFPTPI